MKRLSELTAKHGDDLVKPLEWRDIAYKHEARVKQLEEALRGMMTFAEVTNKCLETWNGVGSPLDYETFMARARAAVDGGSNDPA